MVAGSLCTLYPYLEETGLIDAFIPKKGSLTIAKWCADASPPRPCRCDSELSGTPPMGAH